MISPGKSSISRRTFLSLAGTAAGAGLVQAGLHTGLVSNAASAAGKVTYRVGHVFPPSNIWAKAVVKFADLVGRRTGGAIEVKVFPGSQLGQEREIDEGLQLGNIDFSLTSPALLGGFEPTAGLFDLAYLFRDYDHANKVMDGAVGAEIWINLRATAGIRILASGAQGFKHVLTRERRINDVGDLRGLKIRIPGGDTYIRPFQLLGANPVALSFAEVYTAMKTGVIDGQDGVPSIFLSAKMYEVGKYMAHTSHILGTVQLAASEKTYRNMPANVQQVVRDAAREAWVEARTAALKDNEDSEKSLQKLGLTFTSPNLDAFRSAVRPWWSEWGNKNHAMDLVEKAQAVR
jgi:tripartite ATP-independent transporter DctP family solute receptor